MNKSILISVLLLLVLTLTPWVAPAQPSPNPPGQMSYQGFLTDTNGLPLATNTPVNYTLKFRIYSVFTNGSPVWGEQQVVTVDRGYFTVLLGRGSSIAGAPFTNDLTGIFSDPTNPARYLGITVTEISSTEIAPRLRLLASPYAFLAQKATAVLSPDGSNLVTAANGQLTVNGLIAGNGSGLTALNAAGVTGTVALAQFPATVVTNGASGVTLSGTISGNGGGLTNIPVGALVGSLFPPPGMVLIPAGTFTMGNSTGDLDITNAPPTNVYVSAFYMDMNPVTWSQWQSVYYWATNHGYSFTNPGAGKAPNRPVQTVNWYDCVKWCNARSEQAGRTPVYYTDATTNSIYRTGQIDITNECVKWTASGYRLPTEAEWEKAARGGLSNQRYPWGNVISEYLANYHSYFTNSYDLGPMGYNAPFTNATPYTSPAGYFAPNGYGLYDMAGNVWEWCWDWSIPSISPYVGGTDPHGPASGTFRVERGGSWWHPATALRCGFRLSNAMTFTAYDFGFRCVRAP